MWGRLGVFYGRSRQVGVGIGLRAVAGQVVCSGDVLRDLDWNAVRAATVGGWARAEAKDYFLK